MRPVFKTVDSCGGEVAAETSYLYSSYDRIDEPLEDDRPAVLILGSGPNRIGQGIEFDYCCVQAVRSYRRQGYAAVMVNCNPETVSTDYDTADRLYFEPLTAEDVLEVVEREQPIGVVARAGTPPTRLESEARTTFDKVGEGFAMTKMELKIRGQVDGVDEDAFREAAEGAKENCPVSQALRGTSRSRSTPRCG